MTRYEKGFLTKCAEHGLPYERAIGLCKSAKITRVMPDGRVVTIDRGKRAVGGGVPQPSRGAGFVYTGKNDPRTVASGGGRYKFAPASAQPGATASKRQPDGKGGWRMSESEWKKVYGDTPRPSLPQAEIDKIHAKNVASMRSDPDYIAWRDRRGNSLKNDSFQSARDVSALAEQVLAQRAAARARTKKS